MEAKYIFCFTFLLLLSFQVSCEQKKRSLTFVIDNSYSMHDDIDDVRKAAKSITDIVLHDKASLIEDIVLVTFNDPGWQFVKRTRNEAELKTAIDNIALRGNPDCPEMPLSGIKLGLEKSLPESFLYVFTDASAKDHYKYVEIKNLCQEKRIQVVFILTGKCPEDRKHPEYSKVYNKVAVASNGQVFRIEKENVGQFNIDDKTEYAVVSTSGSDVSLNVQKDTGSYYKDIPAKHITWTPNAKVLKLEDVTPGRYRAVVRGSSNVNVVVFGRTDFNFELGFSNKPEKSLKSTENQPIIGAETHLIISVKDDENSVDIKNLEILDMQENVIKTLPLTHVGGNVYTTEKFLPPNIMFKVAVNAVGKETGKPIRRIANTPVQPTKPTIVQPEIADTDKDIKATEGSPVNINCRIRNGTPKPQITWYFKQRGATEFTLMKDLTDEILRVSNATERDAGEYKCVAENIAGRKENVVQLEVDAVPAFEESPSVLNPNISSNIEIPCKISKGSPLPTITWQFKSTEKEEFQNIDNTGEYLKIVNVQPGNSGFYKCRAENALGTAEQVTQVITSVAPEIMETEKNMNATEGSPVTVDCRIQNGTPKPQVTWYFKQRGATEFTLMKDMTDEVLRVNNATERDTGEYKCVAENIAGRKENVIQLEVNAVPAFEETPSVLKPSLSSNIEIPCKLIKGSPLPTITWQFKRTEKEEFQNIDNTGEYLKIVNVQPGDSGFYKCRAENAVGTAEQVTQVVTSVPPKIQNGNGKFSKIVGAEGSDVSLDCGEIVGNPPPTIKWTYKELGSSDAQPLISVAGSKTIKINSAKLTYSGVYTCIVENEAGVDEHAIEVTIQAASQPESFPKNITAKESSSVRIDCNVTKDIPPATVTWFYKADNADHYETLTVNTKTLELTNIQGSDSGHYKCEATDAVGTVTQDFDVTIEVPPEFEKTPASITKPEKTSVTIDCKLHKGNPPPKVTWQFRAAGTPTCITLGHSGEEMTLPSAQVEESGEYKCVAENSAGRDEKTTVVTVLAPARIVTIPPHYGPFYQGVEGDVVMKVPCTAIGYPEPNVTWVVDQTIIGNDKTEMMYVQDGVLYLNYPEESQSSNRAHTYVCHAVNDFGTDEQSHEVIISKYADYEKPNTQFRDIGKSFTLKCPLIYDDPNSVRWFVNTIPIDKTGPSLYLNNPNQNYDGAYTCRVSDLAGAASYTVQLKFRANSPAGR